MRAGTQVELRPAAEILSTLDNQGSLDGLPFMPEMLGYFGRTFTVKAQVGRACDTIHYTGVRRLERTVLLDDLRCDGGGHAGCQAECRLYWKEAWLRRTSGARPSATVVRDEGFEALERRVTSSVRASDSRPEQPTFRCQATELLRASEPVGRYDLSSLAQELTCGNVGMWRWLRAMTRIVIDVVAVRLRLRTTNPFRPRAIAGQQSYVSSSPRAYRPGELVQIRSKREIRDTLAENGKNRGLWFDREMLPYCNRTARVKAKVDRFIDEGSGQMVELKSDCYILDGVVCRSYHSDKRWFCPRAIYPWWRESWLQPLEPEGADEAREASAG